MGTDEILVAERAQLERAEQCLEDMRAMAASTTDEAAVDELAAVGLLRLRARRLEWLAADPGTPPFFARIDRDGDADADESAGTFHIGRRHVRDGHGDPVVIDWRVPVARAFYQATTSEPMGVRLRRRFGFSAGELTSYEDERLDRGEMLGLASDLLRAEIERPRVGPMRDIVATIQPDQDDLVRADFDTSLCIQGAPGTGKTAVGLHRAAYLLYTFPARLRRSGVLVVGPNSAFLHYVAQVLPTLGEAGIAQTTVDELVRGAYEPVAEEVGAAIIKGDARMADLLRRAVESHIAKPADDLVVVTPSRRFRVPSSRLRRYVDDARRSGLRWTLVRERLRHQIAGDVRRQIEDAGGAPTDAETARIARSADVRGWVDEIWPALVPAALLMRLWTDREFLDRCSAGSFTAEELDALSWATTPRSVRRAPYSRADLVLLDELTARVDGVPTFDHVVVDEAQDLSAMQCRAVARRCPVGSLTVLGDLAQATTPWAPGAWATTLLHLGHEEASIRPLTAGFRVPQPILDLANRLLPHIAVDVPPATSVRSGQHALGYASREDFAAAIQQADAAEGSVGVIVPDSEAGGTLAAVRALGLDAESLDSEQDAPITVVPASAAKGLEYDSVVLVEPSAIVAAETRRADGLRRLYVTLTRAVSHLMIVHDEPLPAELR